MDEKIKSLELKTHKKQKEWTEILLELLLEAKNNKRIKQNAKSNRN